MEFWTQTTTRDFFGRKGMGRADSPEAFYRPIWEAAASKGDPISANTFRSQWIWEEDRKPYYMLWPSLIPMLTRVTLDIDSSLISLPMRALLIRFPVGDQNPLTWQQGGQRHYVRSALMTGAEVLESEGVTLWMDVGETAEQYGADFPIQTYRNFRLKEGVIIEDEFEALPETPDSLRGIVLPRRLDQDVVRIAVGLCLLDTDASILSPDVLSKDQHKPITEAIVDRARRRGKVGWHVGKDIEVIPHMRRPHFGIRWTGKGRTVPKLRPIKGSIVHREVVERLPTGREDVAKE